MGVRPWYKRFPADFISGTLELSLEEKGAYSIILDLLYDRGGPIPDDSKWIARVCGCSTRRWNQIRTVLLDRGKITSIDGRIDNARAFKQRLSEEKEALLLAESGRKGGLKSQKKTSEPHNNNNIDENRLPKTGKQSICQKLDKKDITSDFDVFWKAYPRRIDKAKALKAFKSACKRGSVERIIAGAETYAAHESSNDPKYTKHPSTWLNNDCWENDYSTNGSGGGFMRYPTAAEMEKQKQDLLASVRNKP